MKDLKTLATLLTYREKVERSRIIIEEAIERHGRDGVVVAHSLGKDSIVVWHLTQIVCGDLEVDPVRGFIITTVHKPEATKRFMLNEMGRYPDQLTVFQAPFDSPTDLYETDPDACCDLLKVEPTMRALREMNAQAWMTGLRCTEGRTRTTYQEVENQDDPTAIEKVNPILLWTEREVWQYLALNRIHVNPLYAEGYRSLGCEPCSSKTSDGGSERDGRWLGTSKCGGECGIHSRPMR